MNSYSLWNVSEPKYDSDKLNPKLRFAYWVGHREFVYDLLHFVQPRQIVELGSQYGCSLFAFCQSVKDFQLDCTIHAVDLWAGDIGAPDSGEVVLDLVKKTKEMYYSNIDLKLYPMLFAQAAPKFKDNSIDLIHIDGGHRFEDVEEDFQTWLPKLKENGIILFHDVCSHIDQGSCDHWEYIKQKYNVYFEFSHSCGLGVLFPKGDAWYKALCDAGFFPHIKNLYQYRAEYIYSKNRFDELAELYELRYEGMQKQSEMIAERDKVVKAQAKMLEERYETMQEQSRMIAERDETIKAQAEMLEERYATIQEQSRMIAERDEAIKAQAKMLEERYIAIQEQSQMIAERDETIETQAKMLEERYAAIQEQSQMIAERDRVIIECMKHKGN